MYKAVVLIGVVTVIFILSTSLFKNMIFQKASGGAKKCMQLIA
jgi:hypothetical protein